MDQVRIILASASPRRRELLEQIGLAFEVRVSNVAEKVTAVEPGLVVEELSVQKAEAVLAELACEEDVLVIGADTVVSAKGRILGKPSDEKDAVGMLEILSGESHEVYTGVTLLYRSFHEEASCVRRHVFHERTKVSFYPMSQEEIAFYAASGECMDKAGAYGIQGLCARYIKGIEGDYNNVVGLPVGRLYQEIKRFLQR